MSFLAVVSTFVIMLQLTKAEFAFDSHINCTVWANSHQCNKNTHFMWTQCVPACVQHASDDDKRCENWAETGECTANPGFILPHCPQSCGFSLGWSIFARSQLRLPTRVLHIDNDNREWDIELSRPRGVEEAAVMLLRRVQRVMSGGAFVGMSEHAAPSSFLHSYGVFEVLIYALRALLLHAKGGGAGTGGAGEVAASLEADVESLWPLLSFSGDILARRLPAARRIVEAAAARVDNWQQTGGVVAVSVGADGEADSTTGVSALSKLVQFGRARASERPRLPLPTAAVGLPGSLRISSGHLMPIIGLSTARLRGGVCEAAVFTAIGLGYRHIDAAPTDGNEQAVGDAIRRAVDSGRVTRAQLFVSTRTTAATLDTATRGSEGDGVGVGGVRSLVLAQMQALQVSYLDLYVLHAPLASVTMQTAVWRELEALHREGLLRALGVSDFDSYKLNELLAVAGTGTRPSVLLNLWGIYRRGKQLDNIGFDVERTCLEHGVKLAGYGLLSAYPLALQPMKDPFVVALARERGMSPAEVLIRWCVQSGVPLLLRSTDPGRLTENLAVAAAAAAAVTVSGCTEPECLSSDEMAVLTSLNHLIQSPFMKP